MIPMHGRRGVNRGISQQFMGTAEARWRLRLAAALGVMALAALATGALASVVGDPEHGRQAESAPLPQHSIMTGAEHFESRLELERQLLEIETRAADARAALRRARVEGRVEPRTLDDLEHRLEHLGESPLGPLPHLPPRERQPRRSREL